jgi:hypothetical protein
MSKQDPFPRSAPYRRPDGTAPEPVAVAAPPVQAPQGGQMWLMMGFCVLFLIGGLGLGLFVIGRTNRSDAPGEKEANREKKGRITNTPSEDSLSLAGGATDKDALPSETGKDTPAPRLQIPDKPSGSTLGGGKMTSQPGKPTPTPEAVIEALGGLTAAQLYQTYLNIGLLADAVEGEVYEKDEARNLLDKVSGLMTEVERQLDRVAQPTDEAKKYLDQARSVMAKLRSQSRELRSYWDTDEKDHVTKFHQARQDAWTGIKTLLGIEE